ncbi:MAG: L,D-transpeptidase [Planctomycetaceae bacterium]
MHGRIRQFGIVGLLAMACLSANQSAAGQLVLVIVPEWTARHGVLSRHERVADAWRRTGDEVPVTIGGSGCGWGMGLHPEGLAGPTKREGDGRSPAGVFDVGPAFGIADRLDTGLDYRPMTPHHWCVDAAGSPHYNRIVDDRDVGATAVRGTEPMRRDLHFDGDRCYAVGFVIGHNAGCTAGLGSCIFAHPWKEAAGTTAGCTAMAEADLREILAWLQAAAAPRFALLPAAEHRRHWRDWDLPPPEAAP